MFGGIFESELTHAAYQLKTFSSSASLLPAIE